jgi:dTDP-4-amino-4,6-dideoxygalactose transaminase
MTNPLPSIPLVDLKAQYHRIAAELHEATTCVMQRCDFILGQDVQRFENEFATYCERKLAVTCGSGTDALHLVCRALGIGEGDEVIMPAMTFVATALAIHLAGARPVLVDVDPHTALIDPAKVETAITPRTKAIMPVHLYGQCCDMDWLLDIAKHKNLYIIEDAAQAHGAFWKGRKAGSFGAVGCFSFYPGKNLGAYGDGGAIVTDDPALADRVQMLRNWGERKKYHHEEMGLNSRLDTMQAAILRVKLQYLDEWNEARRRLAACYTKALNEVPGIGLTQTDSGSCYHLYVIKVKERDRALAKLQAAGIGAGIHYPFAVHELGACRWLGYKPGDFPVAESWARQCLSLPIYAELPAEAIARAVEVLRLLAEYSVPA